MGKKGRISVNHRGRRFDSVSFSSVCRLTDSSDVILLSDLPVGFIVCLCEGGVCVGGGVAVERIGGRKLCIFFDCFILTSFYLGKESTG